MSAIDARAIVHDLQHRDIISDTVREKLCKSDNQFDANALLFDHLKATSTKESMIELCETIIIPVQGNPRMKAFGKQMLQMLKGQCSVPICVCTYVHISVFVPYSVLAKWQSYYHHLI